MTKADFSTHENIERAVSDCTSNLAEHCSTRTQMIKMCSSRTKRLVSPVTPDILNHVVLKIKKMRIESFRRVFDYTPLLVLSNGLTEGVLETACFTSLISAKVKPGGCLASLVRC